MAGVRVYNYDTSRFAATLSSNTRMYKMHEPSDEVSSSPLPIMRPERLCKGDHATAEFVHSLREVGGCSIGGGILFRR